MNRNVLKIIAVVAMLIDHIGAYFFPDILAFRIIGRIAFPIFAFFIAEGWKHTRSRKKYFLILCIFAIVSQVPYYFLKTSFQLNILFTFILSIGIIYFIERFKENSVSSMLGTAGVFLLSLVGYILGIIDYGLFGVLIPVVFYFIYLKWLKFVLVGTLLTLISLENIIFSGLTFENSIQLFSLFSLILLILYNGEKGKINLKYFFYIFYPVHFAVIWLIKILI